MVLGLFGGWGSVRVLVWVFLVGGFMGDGQDGGLGAGGVMSWREVFEAFVQANNDQFDEHGKLLAKPGGEDGKPVAQPGVALGKLPGNQRRSSAKFISEDTRYLYERFWKSFCDFLHKRPGELAWHQASAQDVKLFLDSVNPCSKREKKVATAHTRKTSSVSLHRYETVLHRVYSYAAANAICGLRGSPVQLSPGEDKKKREYAESFFLHANYRAKLLRLIPLHAQGREARDAAIVALMACQGLTSAEIGALECSDVEFAGDESPDIEWINRKDTWHTQLVPVALRVPWTGRDAQERRLVLDALSRTTLKNWVCTRGTLLLQDESKRSSNLFISQKGPVRPWLVYETAKAHITQSLMKAQGGGEVAELTLKHAGPMALRTSALVAWLEEIEDIAEVLRRAGLAEVRSLDRVKGHLSAPARERYLLALKIANQNAVGIQEL
jgi:site-specific recombinase XerD